MKKLAVLFFIIAVIACSFVFKVDGRVTDNEYVFREVQIIDSALLRDCEISLNDDAVIIRYRMEDYIKDTDEYCQYCFAVFPDEHYSANEVYRELLAMKMNESYSVFDTDKTDIIIRSMLCYRMENRVGTKMIRISKVYGRYDVYDENMEIRRNSYAIDNTGLNYYQYYQKALPAKTNIWSDKTDASWNYDMVVEESQIGMSYTVETTKRKYTLENYIG